MKTLTQKITRYLQRPTGPTLGIREEMLLLDVSLRQDKVEAFTPEEVEQIEREAYQDLEIALRTYIGQTHHDACAAHLYGAKPSDIIRRDAAYERALETYRRVIGAEPTAK